MNYREFGKENSRIILLLHGGGLSWWNYRDEASLLQSDYHDCVFDMELAYIAAMGFAKVHSLKYVSDNLSLHDYHNLTNGVQ